MARLEYIDNSGNKAVLNLEPSMSVSIGRNPGSTIHTSNPSVSRNHGRIYCKGGDWVIKDLGSSNGTYINDEAVQQQVLAPQDRVKCGDFVIGFFDDGNDPPRSSAAEAAVQGRRQPTRRPSRPIPKRDPESSTSAKVPAQEAPPAAAWAEEPPGEAVPPQSRSRRSSEPEDRRKPPPPAQEQRRAGREEPVAPAEEPPRRPVADEPRSRRPNRQPAPPVQDPGKGENEERLIRQVKEQAAEIEELTQELREHKSMVSELELKLEDLETKTTRYEVELDSITEKYVQIKDQLTLSKERLDEAREELAEKDDRIFGLESKQNELEAELEGARERAGGSQEIIANFKIKLTQKDRQVEEIQRQLDLMEFELRATREELQSLQEGHNADAGDMQRLERRINQLREIITDKENVVAELRKEIEDKDIEIRQVRMGMGMTDLEDEKRKLLEDYYEKNRETDRLRDEKKALVHELQDAQARARELEAEVERKTQAAADITSHPDYKSKVRESKRLEERVVELETEIAAAGQRLQEYSAEEKKRLQGEVAFFKRKSATVEEKLARASDRVQQLERDAEARNAAPPPPPEPTGLPAEQVEARLSELKNELGGDLEQVYEMFVQWRSNFALFKTYLKEISRTVTILTDADREGLPAELRSALSQESPADAMESVQDLLRVVDSDAAALRQGLNKFKKSLRV